MKTLVLFSFSKSIKFTRDLLDICTLDKTTITVLLKKKKKERKADFFLFHND